MIIQEEGSLPQCFQLVALPSKGQKIKTHAGLIRSLVKNEHQVFIVMWVQIKVCVLQMCVYAERTWQMKVEHIRTLIRDNPYGPTALLLSALDETACK